MPLVYIAAVHSGLLKHVLNVEGTECTQVMTLEIKIKNINIPKRYTGLDEKVVYQYHEKGCIL